MNRKMNIGLPNIPSHSSSPPYSLDSKINHNDASSKAKMKNYANARRHTAPSPITPGDSVLVKQPKANKLTPPYNPEPFVVKKKHGSQVTAQRGTRLIVRNSSFFKRVQNVPPDRFFVDEESEDDKTEGSDNVLSPVREAHNPATPARPLMSQQSFFHTQPASPGRGTALPPPETPLTTRGGTPPTKTSAGPAINGIPPPSPLAFDAAQPGRRPVRTHRRPAYLDDYDISLLHHK
eukprot:TRINITY_DN141632_c1_g1_i4.p1 TRINITY_DN141632_c1_g1~~TRINITY_DN141632_c1_g1_i4.p1  ORF type:complete len:235 (-),score=45.01 TRINITY_DN141632_c1_g1_i4:89-793(-)